MATSTVKSYSDDLGTIVAAQEGDSLSLCTKDTGERLADNGRVRIVVTDRNEQWVVDTARRNLIAALLKSAGTKQGKRGRPAKSS